MLDQPTSRNKQASPPSSASTRGGLQ
jgi:hypothetical protein